jgi:ABC-type transport system involved in multi-copper enzyme maturation permease subunit
MARHENCYSSLRFHDLQIYSASFEFILHSLVLCYRHMGSARYQVLTITRFTLLEALRTRLPWLVLATVLLAVLGSLFVKQIAITETARQQTAFLAAGLRLAAVFILGLYITSSMVREFNDKGLELLLSLDLPRAAYVCGKFLGFSLIALLMAALICLPVFFLAPPPAVLLWGASLVLELWIVAALSMFCIITFTQIVPAISFVLAFYILARSITAIRLMSGSTLFDQSSLSHQVTVFLADSMWFLLPSLNLFTQTAWLVNQNVEWRAILPIVAQSAIYTGLLVGAALFDLYRKNL